jgi:sulfide dehydrogenase cytochrome subunit
MGGYDVRLVDEYRWDRFAIFTCAAMLLCPLCPLAGAEVGEIADQCDDCHGAGGVSTESDVPSIAGVSSFIIEAYMYEYREDVRPCRESKYRSGDTERPASDMCAIAKELSEDEIPEIAEYYSGKEFVAATQDFDAQKAAAGAKIHKRDCAKCHSDGGSYADDDAGILAGQWMPYLEQVFVDYAAGERGMLDDKMKEKIDGIDADSISALIHYYASMQ